MRNALKGCRGAGMIEAVLCFAILALTAFPSMGIGLYFYKQISVQYSLQSAMRWATLGETESGFTREQSIRNRIVTTASKLGVTLQPEDFHICLASNPSCTTDQAGGAEEMITIWASHPVVIVGWHNLTVRARVLGRNEPF